MKGLAQLFPVAVAIWMLDIDRRTLVDTAAAIFVITATLLGLIVSSRFSALATTGAFLVGRPVSDADLKEIRISLVTACVFSVASGVVFSLLSFAALVPMPQMPDYLGHGLVFSSLGLLYGMIVVLVLLPAVFSTQRRIHGK